MKTQGKRLLFETCIGMGYDTKFSVGTIVSVPKRLVTPLSIRVLGLGVVFSAAF